MRARRAVAMCMRCAGRTYCKKNIAVFVPKKIHSFMGNIYNFRIKLFFLYRGTQISTVQIIYLVLYS